MSQEELELFCRHAWQIPDSSLSTVSSLCQSKRAKYKHSNDSGRNYSCQSRLVLMNRKKNTSTIFFFALNLQSSTEQSSLLVCPQPILPQLFSLFFLVFIQNSESRVWGSDFISDLSK